MYRSYYEYIMFSFCPAFFTGTIDNSRTGFQMSGQTAPQGTE